MWGLIFAIVIGAGAHGQDLITPAELGFETRTSGGERGESLVSFVDKTNGQVLTIVYDRLGRIQSEENRTAGGRLLMRYEITGSEVREEIFEPEHRLTISRHGHGDGFDMRVYEWRGGSSEPRLREFWLGPEANACGVPSPVPNLDALLAQGGEIVHVAMDGSPGDEKSFGNNIVAQGCSQYPHSGNTGLLFDMSDAINGGARCLASLPDRFPGPHAAEMRTYAARLLGFFQPSFTCKMKFVCAQSGENTNRVGGLAWFSAQRVAMKADDVAQAIPPDSGVEQWPIIGLNMSKPGYWQDRRYPRSVLFHEMLHLLGIKHSEDGKTDMVYLAQACCFSDFVSSSAGAGNVACDALTHYDPNNETQQYQYGLLKELIDRRKAAMEGKPSTPEQISGLEAQLNAMDPKAPHAVRQGTTTIERR